MADLWPFIGLATWLLGVSFMAGLAVQRTRDTSRRIESLEKARPQEGQRLARIEANVAWIKGYLKQNGTHGEGEGRNPDE